MSLARSTPVRPQDVPDVSSGGDETPVPGIRGAGRRPPATRLRPSRPHAAYLEAVERASMVIAARSAATTASCEGPRRPNTSARHRPFGDWAEASVARGIDGTERFAAIRLDDANTGRGEATDPAERAVERLNEGRRPDLLITRAQDGARLCEAEIRAEARAMRRGAAEAPSLSFTVERADLTALRRRILHTGLPQVRIQVFTDGAMMINALRVLEIIAYAPHRAPLKRRAAGRGEPSYRIALSQGLAIGDFVVPPRMRARALETAGGTWSAALVPRGGRLAVNASAFREEMWPHLPRTPYEADGPASGPRSTP